jgi:hypothetical protein
MLIQSHIESLIKLARPHLFQSARSDEHQTQNESDYAQLLSQIKPVKFGNTVFWLAAGTYDLAQFQIPRNADYCAVLRVECYTVDLASGASDFGVYEPVPPGKAYWQITPAGTGTPRIVTDSGQQSHVMCDVDEFRFFPAGETITLTGNFSVSPDGNIRNVRTLVYAYLLGPEIMRYIGGVDVYEGPGSGV